MGNRLYVGNLPYSTTTDELKSIFGPDVTDAIVITDRESGQSKGFGFVTLATSETAEAAIEKFDGHDVGGRQLRVNEARERERRTRNGPPQEPSGDDDRGRRKDRKRQRRQHEGRHDRDY